MNIRQDNERMEFLLFFTSLFSRFLNKKLHCIGWDGVLRVHGNMAVRSSFSITALLFHRVNGLDSLLESVGW